MKTIWGSSHLLLLPCWQLHISWPVSCMWGIAGVDQITRALHSTAITEARSLCTTCMLSTIRTNSSWSSQACITCTLMQWVMSTHIYIIHLNVFEVTLNSWLFSSRMTTREFQGPWQNCPGYYVSSDILSSPENDLRETNKQIKSTSHFWLIYSQMRHKFLAICESAAGGPGHLLVIITEY